MELFYTLPENVTGQSIQLDTFESKHLVTTLRKKAGDTVYVTDGCGTLFTTILQTVHPSARLEITHKKRHPAPAPRIGLGIGYIRPNRLDFILEKGTELGVNDFYLIRSENANYMSTNKNRFEKIVRQALKQSLKMYKPNVYFSGSLSEYIKQTAEYELRFAATSPEAHAVLPSFKSAYANQQSILMTIGPEGGFSKRETELLENDAFLCVSLGDTRLRSETAALTAVAAVQLFTDYLKETSIGTG